MGNEEKLGQN